MPQPHDIAAKDAGAGLTPARPPAPNQATRHVRFGLGLAGLLTLALVALGITDAVAQSTPPRSPPAAQTEAEKELFDLLKKNQLLTARRKVDELLKKQPKSMVGHYVLGKVLYEAEGNLAQAMYHLGRSREIYESRYGIQPRPQSAPWEFHRSLLYDIQSLAGQMDEHEYRLEILDYHDQLYSPDLVAEHAWPLLQLGDLNKARRYAKRASQLKDPFQRSLGLNTLCAIEGEARKRKPYYEACLAAYENARRADAGKEGVDEKHESTLAVHAFNAALAARAAFLPEQAEKLAIEGTRRLAFTPANPWRFLVQLYSDQGKMKDAVAALRDMQRWRTQQPPHVRAQSRAETDVVFSTVLLLAAETETALRLVDLALERPDRRGLVSSQPEQALGAHALLRRALLRTHSEIVAEQASYTGEPGRLSRAYDDFERSIGRWTDEERIISVLSDEDRLISTFRVFGRGGLEPVPVWLLGDLIEVLGAGVVAVALKEAQELEDEPQVRPYLTALAAEVALAQGDEGLCIKRAKQAIEQLPKSESLLRGRTAAVASMAAFDDGNDKLALSFLEQAMQLDPSVIRRLGLSIPVSIAVTKGSKTARLVKDLLEDSPRLDPGRKGFKLSITGQGHEISVCLSGPTGAKLSCAQATPYKPPPPPEGQPQKKPQKESDADYAIRVAEAFHRRALSMPLGLSATDLASLDGSTTVAEQAARDRLKKVLDDMIQ